MDVRIVRVRVGHPLVTMRMGMRFRGVFELMLMPVMRVMDMSMGMLERLVGVLVHVSLASMQPDAQCHQGGGQPKHRAGHAGPDAQ